MSTRTSPWRQIVPGLAVALTLTLAGCGGNLQSGGSGDGGSAASGEEFPSGPVTVTVGQDPGGSTDLIARALVEVASDELGVPMPVVNKPGANGAVAAQELATRQPDGQNVMVANASLFAITSLANPDEALDINDFEVVTGISQDDYVLVTNPDTGFTTVEDLVNAGRPITYGTTGVGTGSQLSQELLFKQAGVEGTAVPFDGGSPTLTAVLGQQVDVGSVQLGEAFEQIEAGELTPIVTFSEERNQYLPDVPTAVEAGYDAPVSQYRAIIAPKGTPEPVLQELRDAFSAAFANADYQAFNEQALLTPHEISGEEVVQEWTENKEKYQSIIDEYGIQLGEG